MRRETARNKWLFTGGALSRLSLVLLYCFTLCALTSSSSYLRHVFAVLESVELRGVDSARVSPRDHVASHL